MANPGPVASNDTVVVGCKLPNGLLLSVDGVTIRINGSARYHMPRPDKKHLAPGVNEYAGDGFTVVARGFWEKWHEQYKDYGPVVKGLVYSASSIAKARDKAEAHADEKTGFEAVDPKKGVRGITPTEEMEKALTPGGE